jgi:hypothetical protein
MFDESEIHAELILDQDFPSDYYCSYGQITGTLSNESVESEPKESYSWVDQSVMLIGGGNSITKY